MERKINLILEEFKSNYTLFSSDGHFSISHRSAFFLFMGVMVFLGLSVWGGFEFASLVQKENSPVLFTAQWDPALATDNERVKNLEIQTRYNLDVLTQQLGRIEANLVRINALGERVVALAHLDTQEFNFSQEVGMGGPLEFGTHDRSMLSTMKRLDHTLERRYIHLTALHQALSVTTSQRERAFTGNGLGVANGWISSFFGARRDPFTGRKSWHSGIDIVGKEGSEIRALASGVVRYSGRKGNYGHLIEIDHGHGLATRYGHNRKLLVREGQWVQKGQPIAQLGSSGRSTGPHLHLEVHKDGQAVDPGYYFKDLRRKG